MTSADSSRVDQGFLANAMASFLQIGAVVILILWCFSIIQPFVSIVVWGLIIAIALYPIHVSLAARLGGKEKWSATLLALAGLTIIIAPSWLLAESAADGIRYLTTELEDGAVSIPPPADAVADWPLIGERVHSIWSDAATNFEETVNQFQPQLKSLGQRLIAFAGGIAGGVFQFIFATIIGAALLTQARGGYEVSRNVASSLAGEDSGEKLTDLSIVTIRSVVKGVLGVAVIQTILAAIGLLVMGVPAAGLLAGAVLVLAIVQLPPWIILLPVSLWVFSVEPTVPATIFFVYSMIVSLSDAVLKPMLLGRGLSTPMLVILIGAIGGAITEGIVGLFIGAVVLALGYELFIAWSAPDASANRQQAEAAESA